MSDMTVLRIGGEVATATGVRRSVLTIEGDRVTAVIPADRPDEDVTWLDGTIVPGLVDTHVHGAGGHAFTDLDPDSAAEAARYLHRLGTTTIIASLVTATPGDLLRGVHAVADVCDAGLLDGIHLEGPWLAPERRGAHEPSLLRDPDPAEVRALIAAGRGHIRQVTFAPERPGADTLLELLVAEGIVGAIGHTVASYDLTLDTVARGARLGTHLFNGMDPWHHRTPGAIPALLRAAAEGSVHIELIADGVHLDRGTVTAVAGLVPDAVVLVSDAMAAAGMPDGDYLLGTLAVRVRGGVCRLDEPTDDGREASLAGGSSVLADQLRLFGTDHPYLAAATSTPADLYGLSDRGRLEPGARADLVVLDAAGATSRVMRAGQWLARP